MSTNVVTKGAEPWESLVSTDCAVCRQVRGVENPSSRRAESDIFGGVVNGCLWS